MTATLTVRHDPDTAARVRAILALGPPATTLFGIDVHLADGVPPGAILLAGANVVTYRSDVTH